MPDEIHPEPRRFTDRYGNQYTIEIDVALAVELKKAAGLDVMKLAEDGEALFRKLSYDPELLVTALYVLCRDQAAERNLSDVQFGKAFTGPIIQEATVALLQAVADFFPPARKALLRAIQYHGELLEKLNEAAIAETENPEREQTVIASFRREVGKAFTNSLDSAESPQRPA